MAEVNEWQGIAESAWKLHHALMAAGFERSTSLEMVRDMLTGLFREMVAAANR